MSHFGRLGRFLSSRLDRIGRVRHETGEASLHLRSRSLPIAFAAFLVWHLLYPGPFPLSGAAFTGSLLLIGYVWARAMATHVTTRRVLRFTALQVGDHLEEILYLENRSAWPVVYAEFIDHSTLPGYAIDGVRVGASLATRQWRLQTVCRQRGVFSLGNWDVHLGDPFGLFEARQRYRHPEQITVYPSLAKLPPGITHHRTLGDRRVLRQALPAETVSAMTTRVYVPGDPLRRIHWRTSARHGDLFVKAFEPEATSAMWLVLDLDEAVHMGQGSESSLEKMIMAAATLAAKLLEQRVRVGLILETEGTRVVPPQSSRGDLWTLLHALALIEPGRTSLATTIARAASVVTVRDSVAVLTPSLDPSWVRLLPRMTAGAMGGLEVWLFDPASFGGAAGAASLAELLRRQGTQTHVLRRDDVQPVEGSVGRIRRWEFRTLATGRAVPVETPRSPLVPTA
jgi:uncharacterized protein (DUF58 family)